MPLEVNPDGYVVDNTAPIVAGDWVAKLDEVLAGLPNTALLTEGMKNAALHQSQVPDAAGVWPGHAGYLPTYDVYWAAINLISFLQAQPVVTQSSSEGTSVSVSGPNWAGVLAYYQGLSRISQTISGSVLVPIDIPGGPHARRVDMSDNEWKGRRGHYGDVNTGA